MAFQKAFQLTLIRLFNVFYAQSLLWRHKHYALHVTLSHFVTLNFCNLHQALALHTSFSEFAVL